MKRGKPVSIWVLVAGFTVALTAYCGEGHAEAADPNPGAWTGGAALGFLANTPDDTAFAVNLNAETFINRNFSVGPLLQLAVTGDLSQIGLSGQAKYWVDIPDTSKRLKLTLQGGVGFVHADFLRDDSSWLIPLGVGLDYALSNTVSATATFLLNFTDLDTGFGTGAHVMPGLTFGLRFY